MMRDGTHQMTKVTNRRKDGVLTHYAACKDCPKDIGPLAGPAGEVAVSEFVRSHQKTTRIAREIEDRDRRMGR